MFNSKKKKAAAEAEQERQERATALQDQLATVLGERAALDERIAALDQGIQALGEQLVTLSSSSADTNRRVLALDDRVGQVESMSSELGEINERLRVFAATPTTPTPPPPAAEPSDVPPPPPPPAGAMDDVDERISELRVQLDDLARQTWSIDDRVTSVATELANQLTELGRDIDELNRLGGDQPGVETAADVDTAALEARIAERLDAAIDEVLDSTERLAAEQARYEIQFRADLAELAERLRRPNA